MLNTPNQNKMIDYIKTNLEDRRRKENTLHGRDIVMVTHPLPEHVNLDSVLRRVESRVPSALTKEVDAIYIGDFDILKKRELKALYYHSTIYVTNEQDNENDLFKNLVHEVSHSIEDIKKTDLYGDGLIKKEFLKKRLILFDILSNEGYNIPMKSISNTHYDLELDSFLYKEVGYDKLGQLVIGVFLSPYAATSIREYWGTGFQEYIFGDRSDIKEVSPALYDKLESLFAEAYEGV